MDWCGSSTSKTPEYQIINKERHTKKIYYLVIVRPHFLTEEVEKEKNEVVRL